MTFKGVIGEVVETGRGAGVHSCEWRIPDFLSLAGEGGDRYDSPRFDACGGKWSSTICPNGFWRDSPSDSVSFILWRVVPGPSQTLSVTLGIRGAEGVENERERRHEFSTYDNACFWNRFCSRSKLTEQNSRLMPGNVLNVSLDLKSVVPSIPIDSSTQTVEEAKETKVPTEGNQSLEREGTEKLKKSLKRLLVSGKDSDVVIKVQGKEFPTHRLILQATSPVFEAMFSHDMVEKLGGVVTMEDCDPESFPAFLEHVYTGSVEMISRGNVFSLYAASEMYDLQTLKRASAEFVKKNLTVASFCDAITLAVKYDEKELMELATEFFCCNSLDICKTVEWQIFLKENTTVGNELFIKAFSK